MTLSIFQQAICLTMLSSALGLLIDHHLRKARPDGWHELAVLLAGATCHITMLLSLFVTTALVVASDDRVLITMGSAYALSGAIVWARGLSFQR